MNIADFRQAMEPIGIPIAYSKFAEAKPLPFITYQMSNDSDFHADNTHYFNIDNGTLELYTAKKDLPAEKLVEDKLQELGVPYSKMAEAWIDAEAMYQVIWKIQLFE